MSRISHAVPTYKYTHKRISIFSLSRMNPLKYAKELKQRKNAAMEFSQQASKKNMKKEELLEHCRILGIRVRSYSNLLKYSPRLVYFRIFIAFLKLLINLSNMRNRTRVLWWSSLRLWEKRMLLSPRNLGTRKFQNLVKTLSIKFIGITERMMTHCKGCPCGSSTIIFTRQAVSHYTT